MKIRISKKRRETIGHMYRHPQLYTNPADVCGICVKLGVPVMFDLLLYRIKGRFQKMDGHMCALPHETQPRKI